LGGSFELYQVAGSGVLSGNSVAPVGNNFQVKGFGNFSGSPETQMIMQDNTNDASELPQWRANKAAWEPGVRTVGLEELDCLGIDRKGNLYWDGKPVEVRHVWLTRWQKVGAVVIAVSAIVGAIGAATQGWVAYNDWACAAGLPAFACGETESSP
jgi:hypothetical protein